MSTVYRKNRKNSDADIIRLNSIGLSLGAIATRLNCHPTSITLRLKALKIPPADTRRCFMSDILEKTSVDFPDELADQLNSRGYTSIKDYVRDLMLIDVATNRPIVTAVVSEDPLQSVAA